MSVADTSRPNIIELRNVSQVYGETTVLRNLDFLIEDKPGVGEFVVVLGLSGSGKSHILRYVAGLQEPTSGEVLIHGAPRAEYSHVPMVFQRYSSLPWYSVLRNVELPLEFAGVDAKERRERAMEILGKVGLSGHEEKHATYPQLSGGQLQRVAIARSLVTNPEIVLMDEPFGALDGVTRYEMQMMLANLWLKMESTVIFITHDIHEAVFLADEIRILSPQTGNVVSRINIDLPPVRDKGTTRTPEFMRHVVELEEALTATAT